MNPKIFIMTHTYFPKPEGEIYVPIQVASALNQDLGYVRDDSGDNISEFNPLFGELTGIYWLWKNLSPEVADYIGICHYRRYFKGRDELPVQKDELEEWLSEYDVITSNLPPAEDATVYESYASIHHIEDMDYAIASLKKLYPEYGETADEVLSSHATAYGNLMILSRDNFNAYCQWLFSILFDAAESIDPTDYDVYTKRVYGFLSETLMNIWVQYQEKENGLRIKRQPILYTQEKTETILLKQSVAELLRQGKSEEARQMFEQFITYRQDVLLPASDLLREMPVIRLLLYIIEEEKKAGISGIYENSMELSELIRLYREVYGRLQEMGEDESEDAVSWVREQGISEIMIETMLRNDLHELFELPALQGDRIREKLL